MALFSIPFLISRDWPDRRKYFKHSKNLFFVVVALNTSLFNQRKMTEIFTLNNVNQMSFVFSDGIYNYVIA